MVGMKKILGRKWGSRSSHAPEASPGSDPELSTTHHEHARFGLEVVYEPQPPCSAIVDIVLVHGLTGDRYNTWKHKDSNTFWPGDLLPESISDARIFTFGYDADIVKIWGQSSQNTIGAHASNLIGDLVRYREQSDSTSRPVIFIAHSLGGLVVQEALNRSAINPEPHLKTVQSYTTGLMFLGTPHYGADLAAWASLFGKFTNILKSTNKNLIAVLEPGSEVLASIQDGFHGRLRLQNADLKVTCFFEELATSPVGEIIVPRQSAVLRGYASESIHANHQDMAKFYGPADNGYQKVQGELDRWVKTMRNIPHYPQLNAEQSECLRSLHYAGIGDRENRVTPPLDDTFDWIWSDHALGFRSWLRNGGGIYWITGKPGSGKSTMMKALIDHPQLYEALKVGPSLGAGESPAAIVATFFFDFSIEASQGSVTALLRSLLWQILKQRPNYFAIVLPRFLEKKTTEAKLDWNESELQRLFDEILQQRDDVKICVFVDALDEYPGDDIEIAKFFDRMSTLNPQKLRLCLSSRPYPDFLYQFKTCNSVVIEKESEADIRRYAYNQLNTISSLDDWQRKELVQTIIRKAQGVFLWVKLVSDRLCHGDRRLEDFNRLKDRLDDLPPGMMAMYQRILDGMDPEDRAEVLHLLCVLVVAQRPLKMLELSFTLKGIPNLQICRKRRCNGEDCPSQSYEALNRSRRFVDRMVTIGCGLIEKPRFGDSCIICHETLREHIKHSADLYLSSQFTATDLGHRYFLNGCYRASLGSEASMPQIMRLDHAPEIMSEVCDLSQAELIELTCLNFPKTHDSIIEYLLAQSFYHAKELDCNFVSLLAVLSKVPTRRWCRTWCKQWQTYFTDGCYASALQYALNEFPDRFITSVLCLRLSEGQLHLPLGGFEESIQNMRKIKRFDEVCTWGTLGRSLAHQGDQLFMEFVLDHHTELLVDLSDMMAIWVSSVRGEQWKIAYLVYNFLKVQSGLQFKDIYHAYEIAADGHYESADLSSHDLCHDLINRPFTGYDATFLWERSVFTVWHSLNWRWNGQDSDLDAKIRQWSFTRHDPSNSLDSPLWRQILEDSIRATRSRLEEDTNDTEKQVKINLQTISCLLDRGVKVDLVHRACARGYDQIWNLIKDRQFEKQCPRMPEFFTRRIKCPPQCPNHNMLARHA